jgi:hypothetical protein
MQKMYKQAGYHLLVLLSLQPSQLSKQKKQQRQQWLASPHQ